MSDLALLVVICFAVLVVVVSVLVYLLTEVWQVFPNSLDEQSRPDR